MKVIFKKEMVLICYMLWFWVFNVKKNICFELFVLVKKVFIYYYIVLMYIEMLRNV